MQKFAGIPEEEPCRACALNRVEGECGSRHTKTGACRMREPYVPPRPTNRAERRAMKSWASRGGYR